MSGRGTRVALMPTPLDRVAGWRVVMSHRALPLLNERRQSIADDIRTQTSAFERAKARCSGAFEHEWSCLDSQIPRFPDISRKMDAFLNHAFSPDALRISCYAMIITGAFTLAVLLLIPAPYGKFSTEKGWGPLVPARLAWILMESPNLWLPIAIWYHLSIPERGFGGLGWPNKVLFGMFVLHYLHRAIIFPLIMPATKAMPISIMVIAFWFCFWNAYNQSLGLFGSTFPADWMTSPQCLAGSVVFLMGMTINIASDHHLLSLRRRAVGYVLPKGGLFEWISCPNYCKPPYPLCLRLCSAGYPESACLFHPVCLLVRFPDSLSHSFRTFPLLPLLPLTHPLSSFTVGEVLEWIGFAIACYNLAGLSFAWYTACNLIPRALMVGFPSPFRLLTALLLTLCLAQNHAWYKSKFEDYPKHRKAVVPFVL